LKRITALQIMMRFIELKNLNTGYFFNMIIELSADGVPNVRFNAARTLGLLPVDSLTSTQHSSVKSSLTKLKADEDRDVIYYSEQSWQNLGLVA
jgi:hypothetical protein